MEPFPVDKKITVNKDIAHPFITITLQIDTTSTTKGQIEQKIKLAVDRVETDLKLITGIPEYMVAPCISKLKSIMNNLSYDVNKKSVIIYLSPFVEKVYYLNFFVNEKVIVGEPLNIGEIILTKREEVKYLVLSLHNDKSFIYLGEQNNLSLIVYNSLDHLKSHFILGKDKFLLHVDKVLANILKTYSLPLVVVGAEKTISLFKSISKNSKEFIETIYSENESEDLSEVEQLIEPVIGEWERLKENYLSIKLAKALNNKKVETGIRKVCKTAREKRGKLLIVEKDFYYQFRFMDSDDRIITSSVSSDGLLISDAVEDAIEKVLAGGGDIEFVKNGVLKNYMHIALIL